MDFYDGFGNGGKISGTIRLYDIDHEAAKANEIIGNHLMGRKEAVGNWKFEVIDDLAQALKGVDFVVISIFTQDL